MNRFKNQIEITKTNSDSLESKTIFPDFQYHKILFSTETKFIDNLKNVISNKHVNAIFTSEETFYTIKRLNSDTFPNNKFVFTTTKVKNVTDINEQLQL